MEDGHSEEEQIEDETSGIRAERSVETGGRDIEQRGQDRRNHQAQSIENRKQTAATPEPLADPKPPSPQKPASPAQSSTSSSAITYIEYDREAVEAEEAAKRASLASQSAANSTFQPILPADICSRQPTPRPSTHASRPSTVPSPFLAAALSPRYQTDPFATKPSNRYSSFGGASSHHVQRQTSLEPSHLDLTTPFESLKAPNAGEVVKGKVARGRGRESVEEWTRRFVEADRLVKENQPVRDDQQKGTDERRRFEEIEGDEEDESNDQQHHRNQASSPRLSSPALSSPRLTSSSSPAQIRIKKKTAQNKSRRDSLSEVASDSSFDRNMTTEKAISMLPKGSRRVGKKRIRVQDESDIEEEDGEEEDSSEEGTDYDE